ncbi:MAG: pentapeptide repeat-containing protein [Hyphomicrobiales bacterium]
MINRGRLNTLIARAVRHYHEKQVAAKEGRLDRFARRLLSLFRDHPFAQLVALMVSVFGVLFTGCTYVQEIASREEEREARAWGLLTTPFLGNSGKIWALEYLVGRGIELNGLDLSCRAMRPELGDKCNQSVYLKKLDLSKANTTIRDFNLKRADLEAANFSGITISNSFFDAAHFSLANFSGATFHNVSFTGATLHMVDITGTRFMGKGITSSGVRELWKGAGVTRMYVRDKNPKSPNLSSLPEGYPDNWIFVCPYDFKIDPNKDTFESECETHTWEKKPSFYPKSPGISKF